MFSLLRSAIKYGLLKQAREGSHCASSAHPPMRREWLGYKFFNMYYFYVLRFKKNGKLYKGFTNNLKRRFAEHERGGSSFSSRNGEFELIFCEAYINEKDARSAEIYFKSGHGREVLKEKLKNTLGGVA